MVLAEVTWVWWHLHNRTTAPCHEKYMIHHGVSSLVSVFMGFSDTTPCPLGAHKLGISRPPCVKPLLPDWMKLSGGLADSDNDWVLCSTSRKTHIFHCLLSWRKKDDKGWLVVSLWCFCEICAVWECTPVQIITALICEITQFYTKIILFLSKNF